MPAATRQDFISTALTHCGLNTVIIRLITVEERNSRATDTDNHPGQEQCCKSKNKTDGCRRQKTDLKLAAERTDYHQQAAQNRINEPAYHSTNRENLVDTRGKLAKQITRTGTEGKKCEEEQAGADE